MGSKLIFQCPKAKEAFESLGFDKRFAQMESLDSAIIRHDRTRGLRVFVRESIGEFVQHVAWMGEQEVSEWTNSINKTHYGWSRRKIKD